MADNFPLTPGTGRNAATDQVTFSGDTADVQLVRPVLVTGAEGSKTVIDLPGDATNGLDVDVTRLPALVAGTANIGDVDVLTLPALVAGTALIGKVGIDQATANANEVVTKTGSVVTATVAVKAILWQGSPVSRSTVLTTELNSLADGAFSAVGSAIDNAANNDQFGMLDIVLASLNPTAGAFLQLFMVQSADGSTYEDAPSSTNPGLHMLIATVNVTTGSAAKRIVTPVFRLPPCKVKFVLYNDCNVSLGASSNTVTLYTSNDEIQ